MILLLALACDEAPAPAISPSGERFVPLAAPRLLRRASLDLHGKVPSTRLLDAVEADPDALDDALAEIVADPALEERLVDLFAEAFLTRIDRFEILSADYRVPAEEDFAFTRSVGEEPLRLMARIAAEDRPWSDIVTADTTMANEHLADAWDIEYPAAGRGWQEARYRDGRPAAGILATNGLWWRYSSAFTNYNRTRAAAITRLLLCQDYLARPVSFADIPSLADEGGTSEAVRTEEQCIACHASLDPLASALFGFYSAFGYTKTEIERYHPEREQLGMELMGVEPAWFGEPIDGLVGLGDVIAGDPRFARCTAQRMAEGLWRREVRRSDFAAVDSFTTSFEAGDLRLRSLLAAVLADPEYRAAAPGPAALPDDAEVGTRMMTADLLDTSLADLTGFAPEWQGYGLLRNDTVGYRVMAGGVDGMLVTLPQRTPSLTWSLVVARVTEAAAGYAVQAELVEGGPRRLFGEVALDDTPGDLPFREELGRLHWRLHAVRADDARLAEEEALWSAIAADSSPVEAWIGLVSVLLRDPAFVGY